MQDRADQQQQQQQQQQVHGQQVDVVDEETPFRRHTLSDHSGVLHSRGASSGFGEWAGPRAKTRGTKP